MNYIHILLFSIASIATANAQTCPIGSVYTCTGAAAYYYDNVGNRVSRTQYCYCQGQGGRLANPAKDSLLTATATDAKGILSVYPNPTNNSVTVEFATSIENAIIVVTNDLGQQIFATKVSGKSTTLDLATQPIGIYLITLLEGDDRQVRRVVKAE